MRIDGDARVAQPGFDDRPRHPVDDAGLLGLGQDTAAARLDPRRALASVGAHAGHHDAERPLAVDLGGRLEQHVDRRPVRRVERPQVEVSDHTARRRGGTSGGARRARAGHGPADDLIALVRLRAPSARDSSSSLRAYISV